MRVLSPGAPVSHLNGEPGVIGLGVLDDDNKPMILSCAHVLAPRDKVLDPTANKDQIVEAPPILNSSSTANRVGLLKWFIELEAESVVDAAVAQLDDDITIPISMVNGVSISGLWKAPIKDDDFYDRSVWRVDQFGTQVMGNLRRRDSKKVPLHDGFDDVTYKNFIVYRALNSPGDSGGAVIDTATNELVGIHFGGDGFHESWLCEATLIFPALGLKEPHGG